MVIKVYISGISASQEVKKRQQRALLILDSVQVEYQPVDITEPGREEERSWVRETLKERSNPLPPQFFSDDQYLGDYEDFNSAVDINKVFAFLKLDSGLDELTSIEENHVQSQNGQIEDDKVEEKETSFAEEKTAEEVEEPKAEKISRDDEEVEETNGLEDEEDEVPHEGERAEEELMEEEIEEEEED